MFIPTAFIPGITGRLYQQFAVTIAISVIFSAFNALTLSPALAALLLKPRKKNRGPLGRFFDGFNRVFGRVTDGYIGISGVLIRRWGFSFLFLGLMAVAAVLLGKQLPTSFLPEEDQGYLFVALQLPDAASLQRTGEAAVKVEKALLETPGVQGCISVIGFSLLSTVQNTYSAFFFVPLKDWDQRKKPEEQFKAIQTHVAGTLSQIEDGIAFSFSPPSIPGVGTSGGVTFVLEDRSGGTQQFLTDNVNKFLTAARKRPELVGLSTTYLPDVPQLYTDVDRVKVTRQGVNIADVYTTMQTFMGGYLVNRFTALPGRQWQVYRGSRGRLSHAHGKYRAVLRHRQQRSDGTAERGCQYADRERARVFDALQRISRHAD